MIKSAASLTVIQLLNMIVSAATQFLIIVYYGMAMQTDVYFLEIAWVNLFIALFSEAINAYLIPVFVAGYKSIGNGVEKKIMSVITFAVLLLTLYLALHFIFLKDQRYILINFLSIFISVPQVIMTTYFFAKKKYILAAVISGITGYVILAFLFIFKNKLPISVLFYVYFFVGIMIVWLIIRFEKLNNNVYSFAVSYFNFIKNIGNIINSIKDIRSLLLISFSISSLWLLPLFERSLAIKGNVVGVVSTISIIWTICIAIANLIGRGYAQIFFVELNAQKASVNLKDAQVLRVVTLKSVYRIFFFTLILSLIIFFGLKGYQDFILIYIKKYKKNFNVDNFINLFNIYIWLIPFVNVTNILLKYFFTYSRFLLTSIALIFSCILYFTIIVFSYKTLGIFTFGISNLLFWFLFSSILFFGFISRNIRNGLGI